MATAFVAKNTKTTFKLPRKREESEVVESRTPEHVLNISFSPENVEGRKEYL